MPVQPAIPPGRRKILRRAQPARLLAINQPARGARLLILRGDEASIGSADANALQITEASVAESHAVIRRRRGRYVLSDLKSTGGTFVNDQRVRRGRVLRHRDAIRFGAGNVFRFIDPDASLRQRHCTIARAATMVLMIFAAGWAVHFMRWDNGLPSLATIADCVAGEQAHASPAQAHAAAVSSAVASTRVASARKVSVNYQAPAAANNAVHPAAVSDRPAARTPGGSASLPPPWLERLNYYRSLANLATLHEDRQLSASVTAHAHYMLINFGVGIRSGNSLGAATHGEDPAKSGYTPSGSSAAENSQFAWGCSSLDRRAQIDQWIAGPFHRLAILDPMMTEAGFGEASADQCWVAALRLPPPPEEVRPYSHAIEFPPDGATVSPAWQGIETPDPLTSCSDYKYPTGLPITLQLGRLQNLQLSASSLTQGGKSIEHCAFDSYSYRNPDANAQEYGRWALRSSGAVVLIPRLPLTPGAQYSVSISVHGQIYAWKFNTESATANLRAAR